MTEQFWKNLYFKNSLVFLTVLSRYSPLSATHFAQRLCHLSNICWNPFCAKHLKAVSAFDYVPLLALSVPTEFALPDSLNTVLWASCKLRVKFWLRLDKSLLDWAFPLNLRYQTRQILYSGPVAIYESSFDYGLIT